MYLPITGAAVTRSKKDLQWCITQLLLNCSTPIQKTMVSIVIELDTFELGWAVYQEVHTEGRWTLSELGFHINYLDLIAFVKDKSNIGDLIRMGHSLSEQTIQSHLCMSIGIANLAMVPLLKDHSTCRVLTSQEQIASLIIIRTAAIGSCH